MAIGLAGLTAAPAAAGDRFPNVGPMEIRIFGANGAVRDFLVRSEQDQRGAATLVKQIDGAIEGPVRAIEESAVMLPHYRIDVSLLGPTYVTAPWARVLQSSFIYFPGGLDNRFMVVEFAKGRAAIEQRWIPPDPQVEALLDRHLQGLRPIGLEPAIRGTATTPWNTALGAFVLAAIGARLLEGRRRWRLRQKEKSAGKGTDQRSFASTAAKLATP
jgi:hypothetical protein